MCLFCAETLAFLAESTPLGQFTPCLQRKTVVFAVVVLWLMYIDNCTFTPLDDISASKTF